LPGGQGHGVMCRLSRRHLANQFILALCSVQCGLCNFRNGTEWRNALWLAGTEP